MLLSAIFTLPITLWKEGIAEKESAISRQSGMFGLVLMRCEGATGQYVRIGRFSCPNDARRQLLATVYDPLPASRKQRIKTASPKSLGLPLGSESSAERINSVHDVSPILEESSKKVAPERAATPVRALEGNEKVECPREFEVSDEEEEPERDAAGAAEEEWRVHQLFPQWCLGRAYAPGDEAIPSRVITIV
ncbi:Uu.00g001780.m01.CDS01 [Anthostomella pinea]|uniref:Uu.00g001780.m01.CDS01 n=1 Tax=Anthostomella pinea TaxID=933095 RepID=A0AAI8VJH8_9PEZI|nr:Uu.00g001780.m01.CDS01 [Anthostomella pinea]